MSLVHQIDHIAFAIESIAETSKFFVDFLGLPVSPSEEVPEQGVRVAFVQLGEVRIELVEPLSPDSPVGKFLAKRGQGLHHVAMRTHDVAAALTELKSKDFPLIDQNPKVGAHGALIAFLSPKGTSGVLTELCQPAKH